MSDGVCPQRNSSWSFLLCPEEDECANGHHDCNSTQDCHDLPEGYHCTCKHGYLLSRYIHTHTSLPLHMFCSMTSTNFSLSLIAFSLLVPSISLTSPLPPPSGCSVSGQCEPVCSQGCVNGSCVSPGVCHCHFGFVGENCSSQCRCNKHSNCANVSRPDVCLECHNNTMVREGKRAHTHTLSLSLSLSRPQQHHGT